MKRVNFMPKEKSKALPTVILTLGTLAMGTLMPDLKLGNGEHTIKQNIQDTITLTSNPVNKNWHEKIRITGVKIETNEKGQLVAEWAGGTVFEPGSSEPSKQARMKFVKFAQDLAHALREQNLDAAVQVESHTDSTPVLRHRDRFRSNLDLSRARALRVAELLEVAGFDRSRLTALGLGDSRPKYLSPTQDPKNRRIVLTVVECKGGGCRSGSI